MNIIKFESRIFYYGDISAIEDQQVSALCTSSMAAIKDAYAVYSNYKVGAAVLFKNGQVIKGSNQENAVYPLSLCAERVVIFSAVSQFPDLSIKALAVATNKELKPNEIPPFPCGSCRQVILEMEQRQETGIALYVVGSNGMVYKVNSVEDILPFAFDQKSL